VDVTPCQPCVILASTNLADWTPVLTNTLTSNSWHVTLPGAPLAQAFYRAQSIR
jgi:hypothetical protein